MCSRNNVCKIAGGHRALNGYFRWHKVDQPYFYNLSFFILSLLHGCATRAEQRSQRSCGCSTLSAGWPSVALGSPFFSLRHRLTYSLYLQRTSYWLSPGKDYPSHSHRREASTGCSGCVEHKQEGKVTRKVPGPSEWKTTSET